LSDDDFSGMKSSRSRTPALQANTRRLSCHVSPCRPLTCIPSSRKHDLSHASVTTYNASFGYHSQVCAFHLSQKDAPLVVYKKSIDKGITFVAVRSACRLTTVHFLWSLRYCQTQLSLSNDRLRAFHASPYLSSSSGGGRECDSQPTSHERFGFYQYYLNFQFQPRDLRSELWKRQLLLEGDHLAQALQILEDERTTLEEAVHVLGCYTRSQ
jgi:hypothetical protein